MPVNGHHPSSQTVFSPSQDGHLLGNRIPVTADAPPSAVRPGGLPAAYDSVQSTPSLSGVSPVDGERGAVPRWQDKGAPDSAPQAFAQSAPGTEGVRRHSGKSDPSRVPTSGEMRKRSARLTLRVHPGVKTALEHIAEEDRLSLSATAATGLEVFVRANIHQQEEELFEPRMQAMMRREVRASDNRHIYFEMRNAIAAEQTRILTTDLYKRQLQKEGVSLKEIEEKLDTAYDMARRNVLKKTPQLKTLLEAWWQGTDEGNIEAEDGKAGKGQSEE